LLRGGRHGTPAHQHATVAFLEQERDARNASSRAHGLNRECLHNVFNAVILAKLTCAVSAWIGFTRAGERERIEAFIRRCKRSELCSAETQTFAQICEVYDNQLFSKIIRYPCHILNHLLASVSAAAENYNFRPRKHNRLLPERSLLHVSLMLILFTEIFTVTFINDCAVTTIFTILLSRLRSINLLFNKRICVVV